MYVDHMHQPWRTLAAIINKCLFRKTIDHKKEKRSRRETMTFLRFTKVIINHFLSQHKSLSKLKFQHYHTIKDDAIRVLSNVPQILHWANTPKNSRGKGSQGKKIADESQETIDVSEESDFEPARKKTASRRVIKKKVTISTDESIIPDLDIALELGKSISLTEVAEEEASRQVYSTHVRIMTESIPKPARRRPSVRKSAEDSQVLQAQVKELVGYQEVSDESTVIPATSSEGTDTQPGVLDEEKVDTNEEEEKNDDDDNKSIDLEQTDDKETDDEFMHGEEHVQGDDEETDDEFVHDIEKTEEVKDDTKKAELPPTSSKLSVFSAPTITTVVLESDALTAVQLRVAKLEKDVSELKKIDHSAEALASLKS
ncbi:hypothetical protein Tco_0436455 [Tanacetum coccineum]